MKTFFLAHKNALSWGVAMLLLLWGLWYARPLDFYDLMGGETPEYLAIAVWPQSSFPHVVQGDLSLAAGEPEMDAVLDRLEELRFHRNPLEVILQFLPQGTRSTKVEPDKDFRIYFCAYDGEWQPLRELCFDLTDWRRTNSLGRDLPLYVSHGQEKGRELGAWFWELSQGGPMGDG